MWPSVKVSWPKSVDFISEFLVLRGYRHEGKKKDKKRTRGTRIENQKMQVILK